MTEIRKFHENNLNKNSHEKTLDPNYGKFHEQTPEKEKFVNDFLSYLETKELIEKDDINLINDTKVKILNLYNFHGNNLEKILEEKIKIEKDLIILQSHKKQEYLKSEVKIKNDDIKFLQEELYEKLDIKNITYKNGDTKQFIKGVIDVSLLQNMDLIMYLKENGSDAIVKIFEEISKMEMGDFIKLFGEILKSLGKSIADLFVGNAYEKGKSFAELGLSTAVLLTIGKKIIKKGVVKEITKNPISEIKDELDKSLIKKEATDTLKISPILAENQQEFIEKIIEILNNDKNAPVRKSSWGIKKIEIPNDTKTKELINAIVSENYPLIEVMRLIPGETVTNITFSGIKKLNDSLGQAFTDKLLLKFQDDIKDKFRKNTKNLAEHSRIIRSSYKNLTFSSSPLDAKQIFFDGKNKDELIKKLITELQNDIEELSIKLGKDTKDIVKIIQTNTDFSIGESILKKGADDKEKLRVFYEAEIISREGLGTKDLISTKFDIKIIEEHARKAKEIEINILKDLKEFEFEFDGVKYKSVVNDIDGNPRINPILLRYVRKYGENGLVEPKELNNLIKEYINELNSGFDFISPSTNLEKDLEIAVRINDGIKNGTLDIKDLLYTYKGTLSKDSFFEVTKGKNGMNAFIDIKDMGIDNLNEFKLLGDKLLNGKLSEDDLLKAGNNVTKKFINTVNGLKGIYGDKIHISLGGDEIYIFIEGVSIKEEKQILENFNKIMNKNNLKSRISHNFDIGDETKKDLFAKLDKSTSINKRVEEKIESLVIKEKMEHILKVPNNVSINIEKGLEDITLKNLDNIIQFILPKIDKKIFDFITSPIEGKIFDLGIIGETRIIFKGGKNSLMEININKI